MAVITATFGRASFAAASTMTAVVHAPGAKSVVCAVLWRASGRAPTEERVIHEARLRPETAGEVALECGLPLVPVTYEGKTFKVEWLLRVSVGEGERGITEEFAFVVA